MNGSRLAAQPFDGLRVNGSRLAAQPFDGLRANGSRLAAQPFDGLRVNGLRLAAQPFEGLRANGPRPTVHGARFTVCRSRGLLGMLKSTHPFRLSPSKPVDCFRANSAFHRV